VRQLGGRSKRSRRRCCAVGRALELNPAAGKAMAEAGHEVASHGWRWINYKDFTLEQELDHMRQAVKVIEQTAGRAPVGWYTGRFSLHTLEAVIKHGGFLYSSDSYSDDLPYWVKVGTEPHLIIPYTLEVNDMKFGVAPGWGSITALAVVLGFLFVQGAGIDQIWNLMASIRWKVVLVAVGITLLLQIVLWFRKQQVSA